jgi:hypothetical protein
MSGTAGEVIRYPYQAGKRDRIELEMRATIGAAGAVNSPLSSQDDPSMSVVHGATGVYAITFPPSPNTDGQIDVTIVSPAGTVKGFWCTAFSASAGTGSITCSNGAGTATDPANGDVIMFQITLSTRKDF